jgi:2-C-methyl-D-erythritol 4-phosphate cytidylyltransferase
VSTAIVAAPPGREREIVAAAPDGLELRVVEGGATRSESVAAALALAGEDLVAVHDAARPLVTPALIDALVTALGARADAAGVIAAAPVADTLKRASGSGREIVATESREGLWAAQTPQVFRTEALRDAHDGADRPGDATDDAMLVELAGGTVLIEPATAPNLKVTTPADLRLAELLLAGRGQA